MTAVPTPTVVTGTRARTRGATTHRAGIWQSPSVRRRLVDLGCLSILQLVGVLAWGPVFGGHVGYVAASGGAALGLLVAGVAAWRRWTRLGTLLAAMLAYLIAGGPLALPATTAGGVVPTVETLQRLTLLSWQSWRDLLTVAVPAGEFDGPAVLPFLVGLATSVLAGSAVLRLRRLAAAVPLTLVPSLALLVVGILWGDRAAPLSAVQGGVFAAVALGWVSWRSQLGAPDADAIFRSAGTRRASRVHLAVTAAVALAIGTGLSGATWALLSPDPDRQVLRDDIDPPLDLRDYPSPLTGYRELELNLEKEVLFTVDGLPDGSRVRLAVMDLYDGNVYNVTEESAEFARAGRTIAPGKHSDLDADVTRLRFEIDAYDGVWLPGGGDLRSIDLPGEEQAAGLYYNPATGTALTTAGIGAEDRYEVDVALVPAYDDDAKAELPPDTPPDGSFELPQNTARVEPIGSALSGLVGDADSPLDQLRAIEEGLRNGYYANGSADNPSLAGHTARRIAMLVDPEEGGQMIGDDEQYAVAMALMARDLGLPARVVMGFYPDWDQVSGSGPIEITGDDAHVWVEVLFSELGWVNFDPTPDEDRVSDQNEPEPEPKREPQVLPPPEVPEDRDVRPPPRKDSDEDKDDEAGDSIVGLILLVVVATSGVLLVVVGPFALIAALKHRRRRRRRNARRLADRVSGGWSELVDMVTDLGVRVPPHATRYETAVLAVERIPAQSSVPIAHLADAHVFGDSEPTEMDVAAVWSAVERAQGEFRETASLRDRLRTRFAVRSLLRRAPTSPRSPDGRETTT